MTDVLIKRELLEDLRDAADYCLDHEIMRGNHRNVQAYIELVEQADMALAAPRQPEGDGLEVFGWYHSHAKVATSDKARVVQWLPECVEPLCRLSDAQHAIAELREECERLRGPEGTVTSARGDKLFTFMSKDPCRYQLCEVTYAAPVRVLIAERDTLRQQLAERDAQIASMRAEVTPFIETHWMPVARQRDKLADLLDEVKSDLSAAMNWGDLDRIAVRINAALAEVNK